MIKTVFVLVMSVYHHGGITTGPQFTTMQQCEAAKEQVIAVFTRVHGRTNNNVAATCLEVQQPARKMKCTIVNNFSYRPPHPGVHSGSGAMDGYPFPEKIECVEE